MDPGIATASPWRFGELLRRHRLAAGLSQEALAERAGLSARGLSDLERGVRTAPRAETLGLLAKALDLGSAERAALAAAARPAPEVSPASSLPFARGTGVIALPVPPTELIGREREVAEMAALLQRPAPRLLTLTGPGGVGKTRLAIAVTAEVGSAFPDGVWFVDLAPIAEPELVVTSIAQRLGIHGEAGQTLPELLSDRLSNRQLLLLLDNFEHLTDAAPVVAQVLAACPHLKVLITSRVRLRLRGEHEYEVPSLPVPSADRPCSLEQVGDLAAVRLFVSATRSVRPDFVLTEETAPAVLEICRRLDGLPLAIELAAARAKVLPPTAMLARFESRLSMLTGGARDLPTRQQTLRDVIAWSHDLLAPEDQALFQRLGVFAGGCTLDAAEAVATAATGSPRRVLDGVETLVDHSLLRRTDPTASEARFGMLETIREYALERLTVSGEGDAARAAHAAHFLDLAEALQPRLHGPEHNRVLARLEAEHANFREALAWALDQRHGELALRLAASLWLLWYMHGHFAEGQTWLERALAATSDAMPAVRIEALIGAGHLARYRGNRQRAAALIEEGLALARAHGDRAGEATAIFALGVVAHEEPDFERATDRYEEALRLSEAAGLDFEAGMVETLLGAIARARHDYALAQARLEAALRRFRGIEHAWGAAQALRELALVLGIRGDHVRAVTAWRESLDFHWSARDPWGTAWCLEGMAILAASGEHPMQAAWLFGAAEALREAIGAPMPADDQLRNGHAAALARAALGEAVFAEAWTAGRTMPLEEAVAAALEIDNTEGIAPTSAPPQEATTPA